MSKSASDVPCFDEGCPIAVRKVGHTGRQWKLLERVIYRSAIPAIGRLVIDAGFVTNFHSVPRAAQWLIPPDDYAESGVVHDFLYEMAEVLEAVTGQKITRKMADDAHREILQLLGCPGWKIALMYSALRAGGWKAWRNYRKIDKLLEAQP